MSDKKKDINSFQGSKSSQGGQRSNQGGSSNYSEGGGRTVNIQNRPLPSNDKDK